MRRRKFIRVNGALLASGAILPVSGSTMINHITSDADTDPIIGKLVALNDGKIPALLERQETNKSHRWYGGVMNQDDIHNPHSTEGFVRSLGSSLSYAGSPYYKSVDLIEPLEKAVNYLVSVQHEDGTIDLYSTNFHSTPDTAFIVKRMVPIYLMLERMHWAELNTFLEAMRDFLLKAGVALTAGGIHTPNHRWVVCAALAWLNRMAPDPGYIIRIDQWLNEGIDLDPDGQFNEKSTSVYTPLSDRVFITMARLLDRPELLDPVRKNLEMTQYYVHPNGEVVTEASGRQDQYRIATMEAYYYPYRYMAIRENNSTFSAMCRLIEDTAFEEITPYLNYLLEDKALWAPLPKPTGLEQNYEKAFPNSGIYRIRRGQTDATIIARNPTFFTMHKGNAVLQSMRLSAAFFGKGQFASQTMEIKDGKYVLGWHLTKPYYQPFPLELLPEDGDWNKMPRERRPLSEVQELEMQVAIGEENGRFTLEFKLQGTDNVPVNLELGFRKGGKLTGVQPVKGIGQAWLLSERNGQYHFGNDTIEFGPGLAEHSWTEMRGALPKPDLDCVYITGYTPFIKTITIN